MTAATIALGKMGIIHGSRTYVIQNEDGQIEEPYSISAGLDYPGIGPMHANLAAQKRVMRPLRERRRGPPRRLRADPARGHHPRIGKRPRPGCAEEAEVQSRLMW